jgi:hypothetical protein
VTLETTCASSHCGNPNPLSQLQHCTEFISPPTGLIPALRAGALCQVETRPCAMRTITSEFADLARLPGQQSMHSCIVQGSPWHLQLLARLRCAQHKGAVCTAQHSVLQHDEEERRSAHLISMRWISSLAGMWPSAWLGACLASPVPSCVSAQRPPLLRKLTL